MNSRHFKIKIRLIIDLNFWFWNSNGIWDITHMMWGTSAKKQLGSDLCCLRDYFYFVFYWKIRFRDQLEEEFLQNYQRDKLVYRLHDIRWRQTSYIWLFTIAPHSQTTKGAHRPSIFGCYNKARTFVFVTVCFVFGMTYIVLVTAGPGVVGKNHPLMISLNWSDCLTALRGNSHQSKHKH